jgi:hypothetical protein
MYSLIRPLCGCRESRPRHATRRYSLIMRLRAAHAGLRMSVRELLRELAGIGETVLLYHGDRGRPRAHRMLTETSPVQDKLAAISGLARYAPRR